MGLSTDSVFVAALQSNDVLIDILCASVQDDGSVVYDELPRLYGTSIPLPDEEVDNVPVPYVIVTFDGLNNDAGTKDDRYESEYDRVNIGIEVVGKTLEDLHGLTKMVRDTVLGYFRANHTNVEDYTFSADAIQYDSLKPCYWQTLRYQCEVYNLNDDEQD